MAQIKDEIKKKISNSYSNALKASKKTGQNFCEEQNKSCCGEQNQEISFGCYLMDDELNHFLRSGMTVVDFGSGPGKDLLLAAEIVGPKGKAIGVDFTDDMLNELRQNAQKRNLKNVTPLKSDIEKTPLESNTVDVVISNCVINLTTDKQKTFNEAYRLLKSNGFLLDADIIAEKPLDEKIQKNEKLWCSCVGGALIAEKYTELLENAGFVDISIKYAEKGQVLFEEKSYGVHSGLIYARKP